MRQSDFGLSAQVLQVLEAKVLYTEDLSHGQHYGAVRAVNPFLEA